MGVREALKKLGKILLGAIPFLLGLRLLSSCAARLTILQSSHNLKRLTWARQMRTRRSWKWLKKSSTSSTRM